VAESRAVAQTPPVASEPGPAGDNSPKAIEAFDKGANLIRNGGFESPRTTSPWQDIGQGGGEFVWTVKKNADESGRVELYTAWHGVSQDAEDHDQSVDIDYQASLLQNFSTIAGQKYTLTFAYAHNPDVNNLSSSGLVRVTDAKSGKKLHEAPLTHSEAVSFWQADSRGSRENNELVSEMNFRRYETTFIAIGAETCLEFKSQQTGVYGFVVDDVCVRLESESTAKILDATAGGKYSHLLRTIYVPDDAKSYGRFKDRGYDASTTYREEKDLPAGYWVYADPYWYIWKTRSAKTDHSAAASTSVNKRRAVVTLVGGEILKGDIVNENALNIVLSTKRIGGEKQSRIERDNIKSVDWLPSAKADDPAETRLREIPADVKLDPTTSPMCVSWDRSWLVHRFDINTKQWQTFATAETPLPETPGNGAAQAIGKRGVAILERERNYAGWFLDFATGKWHAIPASPITPDKHNLDRTQTAMMGSRLVVWGYFEDGPQGAVYDLDTQSWSVISDAPITPRYRAETTSIGSRMFIWFGYGQQAPPRKGSGPLFDGAIYDAASNLWEKIPEPALNVAGYGRPCVEWNGRLVVVGDGRNAASRVGGAIYDPEAKTWETIAGSPGDLGVQSACAISQDRLFVWSGRTAGRNAPLTSKGAVYDFTTRRWKTIATAPIEPRLLAFAQAVGSKVIVWGGWLSNPTERFVRSGAMYDLESDTWEAIPDLPTSVPKTLHPGW
jgi:hypothetical protein